MYESEANNAKESLAQLSDEVVQAFGESSKIVLARTVLPWSEHCTECVWPTCYSTCDLYFPREDGRCRRFVDGMVTIDCPQAATSYILKIRFKRWAKLWTPGNLRVYSLEKASKLEKQDLRIGRILFQINLPGSLKSAITHQRYKQKKRKVHNTMEADVPPTSFMIECYNPSPNVVSATLTMRAVDENVRIPYQRLLSFAPGFNRERMSIEEISGALNVHQPFNIDLVPNESDQETEITLYFGLMDFVREKEIPVIPTTGAPERKKVKCVVWDLDNTLWEGVLVEDGLPGLALKSGIVDVIKTLDGRGILNSIASKNNREEAVVALKTFGIYEYFLYPQISWAPKSKALEVIAEKLNIGKDTLLFVDDSLFELEEVNVRSPSVRVVNAREYLQIPSLSECQVPVTHEGAIRRQMYKVEETRQAVADEFGDNYMEFLRTCGIRLSITCLGMENIGRVHELTQRTNQMNFSGNRYDRSVLRQIAEAPHLDAYVLDCMDRFGSYGIIGFCVVDRREPRMLDLMFSCRIQSKRVEHAFLGHIIKMYISETGRDFYVNYRKTPRNAPSGRVFGDMGMQEVEETGGVSTLVFRRDKEVNDERIVTVIRCERPLSTAQ